MPNRQTEKLPDVYNKEDYSNIDRLMRVLDREHQQIKRANEKIKLWKDIDEAEGATLDHFGKMLGIERAGMDDIRYRRHIKTGIMVYQSG